MNLQGLKPASAFGVLVAIVGIPSSVAVYGDNVVYAVLVSIICLVVLGSIAYLQHHKNLAEFSFDLVHTEVEIHDRDGKSAFFSKSYSLQTNRPGINSITHRNIASEGKISNFKWNGKLIPNNNIKRVFGEYVLRAEFQGVLTPRKKTDCRLTYDLENSFPSNDESVTYVVDFPTRNAVVEIKLPKDRPLTTSNAKVAVGGMIRSVEGLETLENNTKLLLKLERPIVGAEYTVLWDW